MLISPYLRLCGLRCRSTDHPSGREVDSGGGEEGEGKGSRDLEKEGEDRGQWRRGCVYGDGEPERSSTRARVRRHRRGGGGSRSRDCKLRLRERTSEDHVWFEDRWMVASLCDE
jgi:hypothetical protein